MPTKHTTERIYCNECHGKTAHRLVKSVKDNGTDDEMGFWWSSIADVLQCLGCREVVLRRKFHFSENAEPEIRIFPPRMSRYLPNWRFDLPGEMRLLLEEIYRSLDATNVRLPIMGARTLVDMFMLDKIGDVGSFGKKLDALEKKGLLSTHNRDVLFAALDMGNAAAHRGHAATESEISAVMDIVENMLQAAYVFPDLAKKLKKATPPRRPAPPKLTRTP